MKDKLLESQAVPIKGPTHRLTELTPSELHHRSSRLKGTRDIWGGTEVSGIRPRAGGSFLPDKSAGRGHCSFSGPSPNTAGRWALYMRLHHPGSHCLPSPGDSLRLCPTQFLGPPKLLPVAFPYKWLVLGSCFRFS